MFETQWQGRKVSFTFDHTLLKGENEVILPGVPVKGWTICTLEIEVPGSDLPLQYRALAACSVKEGFDRAKGRKMSLARALQKSILDKEGRIAVWDRYFSRGVSNKDWMPIPTDEAVREIYESVKQGIR